MLTRRQIEEIVAFDACARARGQFDCRRYGSSSDRSLMYASAHVRSADAWAGMSEDGPDADAHPYAGDAFQGPCRPVRKTLRYNYIVPARTRKGGWKAREAKVVHVAVRLDRSLHPVVKAVAEYDPATRTVRCRDIDYRGIGGWIVEWNSKDYARRSTSPWSCPEPVARGWTKPFAVKRGAGLSFPWHETVNPGALAETRYRYSQYADGCGHGLCDWLALYREEPMVEALAKAGLRHLATPQGVRRIRAPEVLAFVRRNAAACRDACVDEIVWAARHGRTLEEAHERKLLVDGLVGARRMVRCGAWPKRLDYERLGRLLAKLDVSPTEYARYVRECADAGLDLRNEGTVYPPASGGRAAFMARFEALEEGNARRRAAEERRQAAARRRLAREAAALERERLAAEAKRFAAMFKDRMAELEAFQASAESVATIREGGYAVVVAKTQEELLKYGRQMGNCVGNGMYGRAVMDGRSVIVLLRGADGRPAVCMEIDRATWGVKQCYGRWNEPVDAGVARIAAAIAKALRARHRADVRERLYPTLGFRAQKRMRMQEVA